jgi:pyruvate formate lyase activating enzyme
LVVTGWIFNIQRFSVQDGPGIRTTVFMKGCSLACPWCSNPESQKSHPELAHVDSLCDGCGRCLPVCEPQAISLDGERIDVDRKLCDNCGRCVEVCTPGSLKMFGREISVEEALREIKKDAPYYRNSEGGVTASGGEPLRQPRFVASLFERCREAGIHTALDTCGYAPRDALRSVLEHTDLVLYDLKLIDQEAHTRVLDASNHPILDNARFVVAKRIPLIIRIPLVPGFTDTDENISAIIRFIEGVGEGVTAINVLPYHRFGLDKYGMLDRNYQLGELKPPPQERVRAVVDCLGALGLECEVIT